MTASTVAAAKRRGLPPEDVVRIQRAVSLALEPRILTLQDDHHPAYLHPGRSALIILGDEPEAPADAVVLAAVLESRDADIRLDRDTVARRLEAPLAASLASIPLPGAENLVERLVTLSRPGALAAAAERLDHLRHEHLRDPTIPWPDLMDEVERAWLPFAQRTSPNLARRYAHWLRLFRRRI